MFNAVYRVASADMPRSPPLSQSMHVHRFTLFHLALRAKANSTRPPMTALTSLGLGAMHGIAQLQMDDRHVPLCRDHVMDLPTRPFNAWRPARSRWWMVRWRACWLTRVVSYVLHCQLSLPDAR